MVGPYKILHIVSLAVTLISMALSQPTATLPASILERIQKAVTCRRIPGLAVSVVFNGQEVMSTGFGLADVDGNKTVDDSTRFLLGSITKTFTATLLGMLMSENKYRNGWDTLVADIMGPDFQLVDQREKRATVRDVLSHRMGLVSYRLPLMLGLDDNYSNREYCSRFHYINSTSSNSFRNQFDYNNQMFVLAGCMAEAVANGSSFETLLRKRIFEPLGMDETALLTTDNLRQMNDLALMYYINETDKALYHLSSDTLRCIVTLGPAGGIVSTASDMKKWMLFLMSRGKDGRGRQLIQEDVLEPMFTPQMPMPKSRTLVNNDYFPVLDSDDTYGIGYMLGYYRGYTKIMHTGRLHAFETRMTILRGPKLGIFSACNGPAYLTTEIHQVVHFMITDSLLNLTNWLDDTTACTFPKPWSQKIPRPRARRIEMPLATVVKTESSRKVVSPREWFMSMKPDENKSNGTMNERSYIKQWLQAHHDLYTGIYGHRLFGNFSVTYSNSSDGNLRFAFGILGSGRLSYVDGTSWKLELEGSMAFMQVSHSPFVNRSLPIGFADRLPDVKGRFRSLIAFSFEQSRPPIFRRDLNWVNNIMSKSPFSAFTVSGKQCLLIIVATSVAHLVVDLL